MSEREPAALPVGCKQSRGWLCGISDLHTLQLPWWEAATAKAPARVPTLNTEDGELEAEIRAISAVLPHYRQALADAIAKRAEFDGARGN